MGMAIDCKVIADGVKAAVGKKAEGFERLHGRKPKLRIFTVGDDEASKVYVRNKIRDCGGCGIDAEHIKIDDYPGAGGELHYYLKAANDDDTVDGIIVQLPLPARIDPVEVAAAIDPAKDVDGITPENVWRLYSGDPFLEPCTPAGIMKVLNSYNLIRPGGNAVVVGRSMIVGKPMAMMLEHADMTVTLCHSRTPWCKLVYALDTADMVVSAVGRPGIIRGAHLGKAPTVIDVGITRGGDGKLHGDCDEMVKERSSYYTPVPGGIGLMTRAMLLSNVVKAAERRCR